MATCTQTTAQKMAALCYGNPLYYVARQHGGEWRIRVYGVHRGHVTGLDQLLGEDELMELGLSHQRVSGSECGPAGIVLRMGDCRYYTCFAVASAVGRLLGFEKGGEPVCL